LRAALFLTALVFLPYCPKLTSCIGRLTQHRPGQSLHHPPPDSCWMEKWHWSTVIMIVSAEPYVSLAVWIFVMIQFKLSLVNAQRLSFPIVRSFLLEDGWINLHGHIHNVPPPSEGSIFGPNHINISVEVMEYRPW